MGFTKVEKSKIFIWTVLDVGISLGPNFLHTCLFLIPPDIPTTVLGWSDRIYPCFALFWCDFVNFFSLWEISKLKNPKIRPPSPKILSDFHFMGSIDR